MATYFDRAGYWREYNIANRTARRASEAARYARNREAIREAKNRPCADCGGSFPPVCMDFDHRGDKKFNLGQYGKRSIETLMAEIAKCDVVCANCHRIRTHETTKPDRLDPEGLR